MEAQVRQPAARYLNIMTYEPYGEKGMRITVEATNADGETRKWGYVTEFDGKYRPVTGDSGTEESAVEVVDERTNKIMNRTGDRVNIIINVLSEDGNTINNEYRNVGEDGNVRVFTRGVRAHRVAVSGVTFVAVPSRANQPRADEGTARPSRASPTLSRSSGRSTPSPTRATGFVWRLAEESGGAATDIRAFDDDRILVNMSVWESIDALRAFSYRGRHAEVLRDRGKWFEPGSTRLVMWWVPAGTLPTVEDAKAKLAQLEEHGPSPDAFTFRESFPPPSG